MRSFYGAMTCPGSDFTPPRLYSESAPKRPGALYHWNPGLSNALLRDILAEITTCGALLYWWGGVVVTPGVGVTARGRQPHRKRMYVIASELHG